MGKYHTWGLILAALMLVSVEGSPCNLPNCASTDSNINTFVTTPGGTASANVVTVQGNASGTPIPVTASITPATDYTASGNITAANLNLASGTATAGSTVASATLSSVSTANFLVTGTFSATLVIQVSTDGSNWTSLPAITNIVDRTTAATITAVGNYQVPVPASAKVRITASAYTSGTAVVSARISSGVSASSSGGAGGDATAANQVTGNASLATIATNTTGVATEVTLGSLLKPADTLTAVTTVGTITNPVAVTGTFWQATQPVSGTVTSNAGTNLNTSLLALEGGGNLAAIKTDVDKIPSQGIAATSASTPVVLAKDVVTDISGTITTGGTSQTLRAATAGDKSIEIFNNNASEVLCFNPSGGTATTTTQGSICIQPLAYYSNSINNQLVTIVAATTGHKFTAIIRQ